MTMPPARKDVDQKDDTSNMTEVEMINAENRYVTDA
jgi:hypothetical protein